MEAWGEIKAVRPQVARGPTTLSTVRRTFRLATFPCFHVSTEEDSIGLDTTTTEKAYDVGISVWS